MSTSDPGTALPAGPHNSHGPAATGPGTRTVILIALVVFGQELTWNFYDAQVPVELRAYVASAGVIGLIMGLDNVLGVVLQPLMGHVSDRYKQRHGSRLIFIAVGAPLAALPFALLPWAPTLALLIVCILGYALIANGFKPVSESLLADHVATANRSAANGFIKVATGLTVVATSLISVLIIDSRPELAFAIPAAIMVICVCGAAFGLSRTSRANKSQTPLSAEARDPYRFSDLFRDLTRGRHTTLLLLLVGVFAFNGIWQAQRSLFTPYAMEILGLSRGDAGGLAFFAAFAFLLAAILTGLVSQRVGQLRMIAIGAVMFTSGCLLAYTFQETVPTIVSLIVTATGFACFAVNAVVTVWNHAPTPHATGVFTGIYMVAYSVGGAAGPVLLGIMIDLSSWSAMMLNAAFLATVSILIFSVLAWREQRERRKWNEIEESSH